MLTSRRQSLLLVSICFWCTQGAAHDLRPPECNPLLKPATSIHGEPTWSRSFSLSPSEREIVSTVAMKGPSHLRMAFLKFVHFRLAHIPSPDPTQIKAIRESELHIASIPRGDTFAFSMNEGKSIEGMFPTEFKGTALYYAGLIHEYELLIHFHTADPELQSAIQMSSFYPLVDMVTNKYLRQRYYEEFAAIRAEWESLSLIPTEIRTTEIALVQESRLPPRRKASLSRRLTNASLSFDEYIRIEHQAGRYSLRSFQTDIWMARAVVAVPAAAVVFRLLSGHLQ